MPKAAPLHKRAEASKSYKPHKAHTYSDKLRLTSSQRGYTYKWQQFAKSFLISNPLCQYCEAQGNITPAQAVDHIEPHRGDADIFWLDGNYAATCHKCHNGIKARAEYIADTTSEPIRAVMKRLGMLT